MNEERRRLLREAAEKNKGRFKLASLDDVANDGAPAGLDLEALKEERRREKEDREARRQEKLKKEKEDFEKALKMGERVEPTQVNFRSGLKKREPPPGTVLGEEGGEPEWGGLRSSGVGPRESASTDSAGAQVDFRANLKKRAPAAETNEPEIEEEEGLPPERLVKLESKPKAEAAQVDFRAQLQLRKTPSKSANKIENDDDFTDFYGSTELGSPSFNDPQQQKSAEAAQLDFRSQLRKAPTRPKEETESADFTDFYASLSSGGSGSPPKSGQAEPQQLDFRGQLRKAPPRAREDEFDDAPVSPGIARLERQQSREVGNTVRAESGSEPLQLDFRSTLKKRPPRADDNREQAYNDDFYNEAQPGFGANLRSAPASQDQAEFDDSDLSYEAVLMAALAESALAGDDGARGSRLCGNCGNFELEDDLMFCSECGSPLEAKAAPVAVAVASPPRTRAQKSAGRRCTQCPNIEMDLEVDWCSDCGGRLALQSTSQSAARVAPVQQQQAVRSPPQPKKSKPADAKCGTCGGPHRTFQCTAGQSPKAAPKQAPAASPPAAPVHTSAPPKKEEHKPVYVPEPSLVAALKMEIPVQPVKAAAKEPEISLEEAFSLDFLSSFDAAVPAPQAGKTATPSAGAADHPTFGSVRMSTYGSIDANKLAEMEAELASFTLDSMMSDMDKGLSDW